MPIARRQVLYESKKLVKKIRAGSVFGRKNRHDSRIEKEKQVGRRDLRTLLWTLPFPTLLYTSTSELPTLSYT